MNYKHCNRGSQSRHLHWNRFLTALFVVAMMVISTSPVFAVEATATTNAPDTEVSTSMPDLLANPADEDGMVTDEVGDSEPTLGPVSTAEELLDAIAHANENDVIEFDAAIQMPYDELVLGRADCSVTIRCATSEARLMLGESWTGNIKVQNITFDGAGIQAIWPLVSSSGLTQIFENCNFVNYVSESNPALQITYGETFISDCNFANNRGGVGAHFRTDGSRATIENCTFMDGYAIYKGPVFIMTTEETLMIGCTISGNSAGEQAGGVYIGRGALSIAESKIYGNTANGITDDITKDYWARLSLVDNYDELVELYKSDGVIPNRWTVDSRFNGPREMGPYHADMVFTMTFADNEPSPPPTLLPASIALDKSDLTLYVGETDTLTATLHPEGTSSSVQWTSSDPTVASVNESGFITAHSVGTTSITATATVGGASASCHVNVQAVPVKNYSISISASPTEGGTISGSGQYEEGTVVTVTAVPNEDFRFLAWTEADTQISTEASLTFTVTSDRTLTAIFEPISKPTPEPIPKPIYTINTSATVGGTVSGAGKYEHGSSVTLTATPDSGYLFVGWTENNERIGTDASFTFIADCDRTFAADFIPITQPTYTINTSATAGGTASGGGEYEQGRSVTLIATPETGYRFVGWTENGEQVSVDETFAVIADCDRAFVANFAPIPKLTYTIQVNSTQGGVTEGSGSYQEGDSITVSAEPDAGYRFLYWEEDGVHISTDESLSFTVDCDRTLVANFEPIHKPAYTVQVNSTQNGAVEGGGIYEEGEPVTVNAIPDNGYRFLRWQENSVQVSTEARYSFTAEADRTLVAIFELIPQSVPDSTYEPSYGPGIPSTSYRPSGGNSQPTTTSLASREVVQIPTLANGKAALIVLYDFAKLTSEASVVMGFRFDLHPCSDDTAIHPICTSYIEIPRHPEFPGQRGLDWVT